MDTQNLTSSHTQPLRRLTLTLALSGLALGLTLGLGLLSGDAQGRVNLLYLLLLLAFLPVAGLLLSLIFLLRDRGRGFSGLVLDLPVWPAHWRRALLELGGSPAGRDWFFYQTQVLALSFGLGGLGAFFLVLLASDVSFVWRSTLLDADDLLPVLRALALPWFFWDAAQPSLALLESSRDFRLTTGTRDSAVLGAWWQYVLAAQCCYNLLPRGLLLVLARRRYRKRAGRLAGRQESLGISVRKTLNRAPEEGELAAVVHEPDAEWALVDWAGLPQSCRAELERRFGEPRESFRAGPLAEPAEEEASRHLSFLPVVAVKSWEPPMGELRDYLEGQEGLVMPLDWEDDQLRPLRAVHRQEWRRFCGTLPGWGMLELKLEVEA